MPYRTVPIKQKPRAWPNNRTEPWISISHTQRMNKVIVGLCNFHVIIIPPPPHLSPVPNAIKTVTLKHNNVKIINWGPADDWRWWMNEYVCASDRRWSIKNWQIATSIFLIQNVLRNTLLQQQQWQRQQEQQQNHTFEALFPLFQRANEFRFYVCEFIRARVWMCVCVCVSVIILLMLLLWEWIICLLCTTINYLFAFRLLLPQIVAAMLFVIHSLFI